MSWLGISSQLTEAARNGLTSAAGDNSRGGRDTYSSEVPRIHRTHSSPDNRDKDNIRTDSSHTGNSHTREPRFRFQPKRPPAMAMPSRKQSRPPPTQLPKVFSSSSFVYLGYGTLTETEGCMELFGGSVQRENWVTGYANGVADFVVADAAQSRCCRG